MIFWLLSCVIDWYNVSQWSVSGDSLGSSLHTRSVNIKRFKLEASGSTWFQNSFRSLLLKVFFLFSDDKECEIHICVLVINARFAWRLPHVPMIAVYSRVFCFPVFSTDVQVASQINKLLNSLEFYSKRYCHFNFASTFIPYSKVSPNNECRNVKKNVLRWDSYS